MDLVAMVMQWSKLIAATQALLLCFHPTMLKPWAAANRKVAEQASTKVMVGAFAEHHSSRDANLDLELMTQTSTSLTQDRQELLAEALQELDYETGVNAGAAPSPRLFLWLQCTLPKITARVYHVETAAATATSALESEGVRVSVDVEDITLSVDSTPVFTKTSCKLGQLAVRHHRYWLGAWTLSYI
jgi:hypothetical protein